MRERKLEKPQMKPNQPLCRALEMLSEVRPVIIKTSSLLLRSSSWTWREDLTTKRPTHTHRERDEPEDQYSARISLFHATPDLLHLLNKLNWGRRSDDVIGNGRGQETWRRGGGGDRAAFKDINTYPPPPPPPCFIKRKLDSLPEKLVLIRVSHIRLFGAF